MSKGDPDRGQPVLVRDAAVGALERTTGVTLAKNGHTDEKSKAWQRWWETQHSKRENKA